MNFKHVSIYILWLFSLVLAGRLTWEYASRSAVPEKKEYVSQRLSQERPYSPSPRRETPSYDVSRPRVESFVFDNAKL